MEEERVIRLRTLHQPMHCSEDVRLGRLAHGVLLIVREDHHVLSGITEVLIEIGRHVLDIVNAAAQLSFLIEIVDANQQCLPLSCATRILEVVALGRTVTERDRSGGRRCRSSSMMSLAVGVSITGWWHASMVHRWGVSGWRTLTKC